MLLAKKLRILSIFDLKGAEIEWVSDNDTVQEFQLNGHCFASKKAKMSHKCTLCVFQRNDDSVESSIRCADYDRIRLSSTICTRLQRCLWGIKEEKHIFAKVWKTHEYQELLEELNEKIVFIEDESIYLFRTEHGHWITKTESDLRSTYKSRGMHDKKYLIEAFFADIDRRMYKYRVHTPEETPDSVFNTYIQPNWKTWNLDEEAKNCSESTWTKIMNITESLFCSENEINWFRAFLGHAVFRPTQTIDVACVLFDSQGGSGKSLLAYLMEFILGNSNTSIIKRPENELFDKFSESYTQSTLLVIEELKGLIGHKHENDFKNIIGSKDITFCRKGIQGDFVVENHLHVWCNTNERNALKISEGNTRRWAIFEVPRDNSYCSSNTKRWSSYQEHRMWFSELYDAIFPDTRKNINIPLAAKFVLWLKESQWKSFTELEVPTTSIKQNLISRSMPLECEFLVHMCEQMIEIHEPEKKMKFSDVYAEFKKFVGDMRITQKSSIVKSNFKALDIEGMVMTFRQNIEYMDILSPDKILEEITKRF